MYKNETIEKIKQSSDTITIGFSCGKDSIVSMIVCRDHFKTIYPIYYYTVPNLQFVEESLCYYEDFFKTKIYRLPHPFIFRALRNRIFQTPENHLYICTLGVPNVQHEDILREFKDYIGIPQSTYHAIGVRTVDNPMRAMSIKKSGAINYKKHTFYPIHDMRKDILYNILVDAKINLPIDYQMFGRSFDGIHYQYLKPIKDMFPDDYQKIIDFFPLAEAEIERYKFCEKARQSI